MSLNILLVKTIWISLGATLLGFEFGVRVGVASWFMAMAIVFEEVKL